MAALSGTHHDREVPEADLLGELVVRGVTLRNRIVMSRGGGSYQGAKDGGRDHHPGLR